MGPLLAPTGTRVLQRKNGPTAVADEGTDAHWRQKVALPGQWQGPPRACHSLLREEHAGMRNQGLHWAYSS